MSDKQESTAFESRLERETCRKFARICKEAPDISTAVALYDRAYRRYKTMVNCAAGPLIEDVVAYTNALARYCTMLGAPQHEIR